MENNYRDIEDQSDRSATRRRTLYVTVGMRMQPQRETGAIDVVVFGSDQGLVGQLNEVMVIL
ncbi:MAG: F0F1-type ATP synthase gamma subunit [Motiliproteus sp.]|jgi:F0F1-type ATP synthase gamma subunit